MKTGIEVSFPLEEESAREAFSHLRLLGYDCADLQTFVQTDTDWFGRPDLEQRWRAVGRIAREEGITISQTHGPWRFPPRDETEADRAERFEKMALALEGSKAVGAPCMAIHNIMPFGCDKNPEPERFLDMNREFFSRLLAVARDCGVVLALENMPFTELLLSTPAQVMDFVKEFNDPFLRVCLDTGHAAVFGLGAGDSVRLVGKEYLACLHVHDNDGKHDLHWTPFRGVVDWADFSKALYEVGFEGSVSLETNVDRKLPAELRPAWEAALAQTARYIALFPGEGKA